MKDLAILLENRPGALAEMGSALGQAGISIEGGGAFLVDGKGIAHFLFENGEAAREALQAAGIPVLAESDVVVQKLDQATPGQMGKLSRKMADAGVNLEVVYSDHNHQLVLVVDDPVKGSAVSKEWTRQRAQTQTEVLRKKHHTYETLIEWTGNDGEGTSTYRSYRRDHTIVSNGRPVIAGSSGPAFRGNAARYNPEELLLAALSSCHMLSYLHMCAVGHVVVMEYRDAASGVMNENADGSGEFTKVVLRPTVKIAPGSDYGKALALHHEAHRVCFIARSVNFPVEVVPGIVEVLSSESPVRRTR